MNKYSKENNELLLRFRGYTPHPTEISWWVKDGEVLKCEIQYDKSWDWIIRVVDEIKKFNYKQELRNPFINCGFLTDHAIVYSKCVDFVKQYNKVYGVTQMGYQDEYYCVEMYLNSLSIPKEIEGSKLSLVGRIKQLEKRFYKELSDLETTYLRMESNKE